MYYNYHGIIKKKIKNGLLTKVEFKNEYHGIKNATLLFFNDGSRYPIREERIPEYLELLGLFKLKK